VAINIDLVADVKGVIRGTDKIGDALDEVADDLKDVGKHGETLDDKVSSAFKSMASDAKKAGKDIGHNVKSGTDKAGEGFKDMRDESASTARESAASFGSIEDAADSLQEILANAFAGFGPAGMAAGLVAAAGIGLAITAMQDGAETATAAKQKAVDMVDALAEAGGKLADVDVADKIKTWGREVIEDNWMTFWANEASTKFQEVAKDAETYGVSSKDAIRAAAGSADDSRKFLDATADSWQELARRIDEGTTVSGDNILVMDESATTAKKQQDALSDLRGQAEENIRTTQDAVDIYGLEAGALDGSAEATRRANDALKDRAAALDDSAAAAMGADQAELDYVETMIQSAKDIEANGKTVDINTEAGRANRKTLLEMATASQNLIAAQIAQGDSTATVTKTTQGARDSFINAATAAGYTKDQAKALADQYGLVPKNVDTKVKAHGIPEAEAAINNVARPREVPVHISPQGQQVENYINGLNGRRVYIDVAPKNGIGITS
jgi:hypothetical protein